MLYWRMSEKIMLLLLQYQNFGLAILNGVFFSFSVVVCLFLRQLCAVTCLHKGVAELLHIHPHTHRADGVTSQQRGENRTDFNSYFTVVRDDGAHCSLVQQNLPLWETV